MLPNDQLVVFNFDGFKVVCQIFFTPAQQIVLSLRFLQLNVEKTGNIALKSSLGKLFQDKAIVTSD